MPFCRANTLPAFAKRQERIQILNKRSITMRRSNQIWLTGALECQLRQLINIRGSRRTGKSAPHQGGISLPLVVTA